MVRGLMLKMAELDVKRALKSVLAKIEAASKDRPEELKYIQPTLVAVSKTKPIEAILEAYEEGQRHFGENYIQELEDKATNPMILEKCGAIRWHFIGPVQTNKANKLLAVPNLYMVETLHSLKLANHLNKPRTTSTTDNSKLNVMIQVNTSGEEGKSGIPPSELLDLTKHVLEECTNLNLVGLMTIGKFGYDLEEGPNPDFVCLRKCRDEICQGLGLDWKKFHLSMGMSDDFEHAIKLGSTHVRVGSLIFGDREKKH